MSPPYWAWQGGDVGGDWEVCLLICLVHLLGVPILDRNTKLNCFSSSFRVHLVNPKFGKMFAIQQAERVQIEIA